MHADEGLAEYIEEPQIDAERPALAVAGTLILRRPGILDHQEPPYVLVVEDAGTAEVWSTAIAPVVLTDGPSDEPRLRLEPIADLEIVPASHGAGPTSAGRGVGA